MGSPSHPACWLLSGGPGSAIFVCLDFILCLLNLFLLGLERWLGSEEQMLLLQRAHIQFLHLHQAALTTTCNSSSRGSNTLSNNFWSLWVPVLMCTYPYSDTYTQRKLNIKIFLQKLHLCVRPAHMYMYHMHVVPTEARTTCMWCLQRAEES